MNSDLRVMTRRVRSAVAPLSDRDRRVIERRARRAASSPDIVRDAPATLGRRIVARVAAMIASLPGVTIVTGRPRRSGPGEGTGRAANEDRPALRAA